VVKALPDPVRPLGTVRPPEVSVRQPHLRAELLGWTSHESLEASEWKVKEGRNKKPTFKPTFDYLLNKYTKAGPKDRAMKWPRSLVRQERREQPKQTKPKAKGKGIAEERYDPRNSQHTYFSHPFGHPGASSSTGFPGGQLQCCPPPMMLTYPIWDPYHQIWVNYLLMMPMTPWGWGAPHQPIIERLEFPTNDRIDLSSNQQNIESINEEKVMLKSEIEKTTTNNVIQIGTSQVKLDESLMDRSSSMIGPTQSWKMSHRSTEKRRSTRL
jgi:hypothetical protein